MKLDGMADALLRRPEAPRSVWVVGKGDDHIEAAFSSKAAAEAYFGAKVAPDRARYIERYGEPWGGYTLWWVDEIPLDPVL